MDLVQLVPLVGGIGYWVCFWVDSCIILFQWLPRTRAKQPPSPRLPSGLWPTACTTTLTHPLAPPRGNCAQSSLPHVINKHGIVFVDDVQCERYNALVIRKISARKYLDIEFLQALDLLDDMNTLLAHLGWLDYLHLKFPVYKKLVWEFFSSFTIDTAGEYHNGRCYIRFRLGDLTHEMNLARFSEFL